jgi:glycosyltransferase involved in cell wall biosynthesis
MSNKPLAADAAARRRTGNRSLRVLFVGKNHLPHVGGSEISTHHLAAALAAEGHAVIVLARLSRRSVTGIFDSVIHGSTGRTASRSDSSLGYPTVRGVLPLQLLEPTLASFQPDVVVVTGTDSAFASDALARSRGFPSLLYVRDPESAPVAVRAHADRVVTNSRFMARSMENLGIDARFLPSIFPIEPYAVSPRREKVLFVNPVPKKGVEIALHLAERRPDIPFVFSLSWRIRANDVRWLTRTARKLGNIEIRKATRNPAMLFRDTRVLLVPSRWAEPWGRVASEAQISGIPVVGSRIGGLPEAIGPGGILVDPPDSREAWLKALSDVWDDEDLYEHLSQRALDYSQRKEISVDLVVQQFEELLMQAIDQHERCE